MGNEEVEIIFCERTIVVWGQMKDKGLIASHEVLAMDEGDYDNEGEEMKTLIPLILEKIR